MCGIFGIFTADHRPKIESAQQALDQLAHRGPDARGSWAQDQIFLGHHRLAIFDTSAAASQPMHYQGVTIVFNGAVYNFRELRRRLESKGHTFQSNCDTEVVLKSYVEKGMDCLSEFNGQWAFALWDENIKQLILSRDRFGIKPLYIWQTPQFLAFSSEIKAFTRLPEWNAKLNQRAAFFWLNSGREDLGQETMFVDVMQLNPGSYLVVDCRDKPRIHETVYYEPHLPSKPVVRDRGEWLEELRDRLDVAIQRRTVADRPLGFSLSGGIDSSYLTARALGFKDEPSPSFSIVYPDEERSERQYVQKMMERFDLSNQQEAPRFEEFLKDSEKLIAHHEFPIGGFGVYAQFRLHQLAQNSGIKVMLGGQGADEILAGYPRFFMPLLRRLLSRNPWKAYRTWREVSQRFQFLRPVDLRAARAFFFPRTVRKKPWLKLAPRSEDQEPSKSTRSIQSISIELLQTGLQTLLRYEDRNSMAHGIESRVPFLDHHVVEWALAMPDNLKIEGSWSKWALRKLAENQIPREIAWREDKLGFSTPQQKWLLEHRSSLLQHVEKDTTLGEILDVKYLPRMEGQDLFRIFVFSLWNRVFHGLK